MLTPDLQRLAECIEHFDAVRGLFAQMDDDGERDRAWTYLSDRFGEYEKAEVPAWDAVEDDAGAAGKRA